MSKISYEPFNDVQGISFKYSLNKPILKTHFKKLMRMTKIQWDRHIKISTIPESERENFLVLVAQIEKSSDERCEKSLAQAKAKKARAENRTSCDHSDLGSLGYRHGAVVSCPFCGGRAEVW